MVRDTNLFFGLISVGVGIHVLSFTNECIINEIYHIINYIGDKFKTNLQIEYHDKII